MAYNIKIENVQILERNVYHTGAVTEGQQTSIHRPNITSLRK